MPLVKKKNNGSRMATINQDNRTASEKAKAKALFDARKKKEEDAGADFDTPEYLQEQSRKRKERLARSVGVGVAGGLLGVGPASPIATVTSPLIPSVMSAMAGVAEKIIPKEKQKGELYEAMSNPKIKKSKFVKKSK